MHTSQSRKDLEQWIAHVEEVRSAMNELARKLHAYGDVSVQPEQTRTVGELPYIAEFNFGETIVTIRFLLKDHQTDSDVVITNMTTLPEAQRSKGFGTQAVQLLLRWAADNNLLEMRATQVSNTDSGGFWEDNGFTRLPEPNPCGDFVHAIKKPT